MAQFIYTATRNGKTIKGTITASTKEAAQNTLERQGVRPIVLKESSTKQKKLRGKVKGKDIVVFTRQLSTMISAGVPLNRCFVTLQEQTTNKYFKEVIAVIAHDIEGGSALADALGKHPNVFSDVYINMVRAGESGGILEEILKRIATQVEKDASIRKKIKSASTYPTVVFGITILAFFGIMIAVIPRLGKIIKDLGGEDAKLPIYTEIMLSMSEFMQKNAFFIAIATFLFIYFLRRYIKTPKGKYKFHALLLRTPILKMIIIKIAIARFSRTFASLMSAGVSVLDALEATGGAMGNKVIEEELRAAAKEVKNGKQLSEPLSKSKYFPAIVSQMLSIGEETGQMDTVLIKVADFYEEEVDAVIDGISSLIEPLMIVVLGAMVGIIAASVMGPISSLSKNVGS